MALKNQFQSIVDNSQTITIESGQQVSNALDASGMALVGIRIPASFTGRSISFQEAPAMDGAYQDVFGVNGSLVSIPVTPSRTYLFAPGDLASLQYIKIKSASAEAAVRNLSLILRAV